jgi:hypothetical protein
MSEQETEQPQSSQPSEPSRDKPTEPDPEGGTPMGSPDAAQDAPDGPHGSPQPK